MLLLAQEGTKHRCTRINQGDHQAVGELTVASKKSTASRQSSGAKAKDD